ncbi:MAG: hypothetical protein NZ802_04615, partial [Candidatus Poseidoniales archaeon]|nr:hypothetical protein [Candidatus Poseidoniales archaeon]
MTTQTDPVEISVAAKERLAKLLATENVTVEHRNVPTAAFDIKDRVLVLPNWKDITKDIYDLLVCHEVGHALWTPFEGWHGAVSTKGANYKGFLNIAEDARIEKKIKRKFPGARRSFVSGYKELIDRDFFGIKDRNLASFGLIDRLNIHFKAGFGANVPFSDDEKVWVDRMSALETFEEAVALADDLFDEMKSDTPETDTGRGEGRGENNEGEEEEGESLPAPGDDDNSDDSEMGDESPFGDDDADGESDTDGDAPSGAGDGMEDADDSDSNNTDDDDDDTSASNGDDDSSSDDDDDDDDDEEEEGESLPAP